MLGYYWPTIKADYISFAKKCDQCQKISTIHRRSGDALIPISSPWTFSIWGINLAGSLLWRKRRFKYIVVAYLKKWVEAEPLVGMPYERVLQFIWKNIIYRYGMP